MVAVVFGLDKVQSRQSRREFGGLAIVACLIGSGNPCGECDWRRSEPAKRTIVAEEVNGVIGDNHEPSGEPDGQAIVVAGFGRFRPRVVAGAIPVLSPYQIACEPEAIDSA